MSEVCITAALRRMGYSGDQMTWHGFRTIASTCLNDLGWASDLIERQLAHVEKNDVRAAYNRAQRLPERRQMMQAWADTLDRLREGKPLTVQPAVAPAQREIGVRNGNTASVAKPTCAPPGGSQEESSHAF